MASDGGAEAGVSHSGGVAVGDGLEKDRVVGNLVPIDLRRRLVHIEVDVAGKMYSHP